MQRVLLWARSNEDVAWTTAARALARRQWPTLRAVGANASQFDTRGDLDAQVAVAVVQPTQHEIAARFRAAGIEVFVFDGTLRTPSPVASRPPERPVPLHVVTQVAAEGIGRAARRRRAVG